MKIGFVGAGRIAQAMIKGWLQAGIARTDIYVQQTQHQTAQKLAAAQDLTLVQHSGDLGACDIVIVAVPGSALEHVVAQLGQTYHGLIVSTSGGDLQTINTQLPKDTRFIKVVPNTPVQINQGISILSFAPDESAKNQELLVQLFQQLGQVYVVPEALLSIYGTVAGCTPAFVAVLMEALADVAVQYGISRTQAQAITNQMLKGTAMLAQSQKVQPSVLKDEVATPGGSTIRGVVQLEKAGFRSALIQAVTAANQAD